MQQLVFDPRGIVSATNAAAAPRRRSLAGARLLLLDNSKWNASKLLVETSVWLTNHVDGVQVSRFKKDSFSRVASDTDLRRFAQDADAVITAIAD